MITSPAQPGEPSSQEGSPEILQPQHPAVSVVIPVLNGSDVLPDQLQALSRQTYTGVWEVVVADNGSTDGTGELAASFSPRLPLLRILRADSRPGPSHARNVGARAATGDLLLFCDADDVVSPGWVEAMVVASQDAAVLAGSGAEARDPHTVDPSVPRNPSLTGFRFLPWNRSSNIGVHRRVFESLGGFDEDRVIGEDVDFCWRAQLAGHELRFVSDAFVAYRERSTLWTAMQRQFRFGRAAPGLYLDFGRDGAPKPSFLWAFGDLAMTILRFPKAVLRRDMRGWLNRISGSAGRLVGWVSLGRS